VPALPGRPQDASTKEKGHSNPNAADRVSSSGRPGQRAQLQKAPRRRMGSARGSGRGSECPGRLESCGLTVFPRFPAAGLRVTRQPRPPRATERGRQWPRRRPGPGVTPSGRVGGRSSTDGNRPAPEPGSACPSLGRSGAAGTARCPRRVRAESARGCSRADRRVRQGKPRQAGPAARRGPRELQPADGGARGRPADRADGKRGRGGGAGHGGGRRVRASERASENVCPGVRLGGRREGTASREGRRRGEGGGERAKGLDGAPGIEPPGPGPSSHRPQAPR
jgi:hypothetical protein